MGIKRLVARQMQATKEIIHADLKGHQTLASTGSLNKVMLIKAIFALPSATELGWIWQSL
jgi:hypothetical protein